MGRLTKLKEAIFGEPEKKEIQEGNAVLGQVKQDYGTTPTESFVDLVDVFNKDPVIKESIVQFAEQVVSTGIFTTVDDSYKLKLPNGDTQHPREWTCKEAIDYWNTINNLDEVILQIAIELVAFGNSFWMIDPKVGFRNIPVEAIFKALPKEKRTPVEEVYDLQLTASYSAKILRWGSFIHFKCNVIGNHPFGTGVLQGLIATPDSSTPSLYTIRKSVRAAMKIGFEKFSFGNELWVFEGLSDNKIDEIGKQVASMSNTGNRIATNVRGDIRLSVPQRTQSYDRWLDTIENEFLTSLANPSLKMGPEKGWLTKASAETAQTMFEYKIEAMRRTIKRQVEDLWNKVLEEMGFDSVKANVRLNFGAEEMQLDFDQIIAAVNAGIMSKKEARKHLIKIAKIELEGEKPPEEPEPEPTPEEQEDLEAKKLERDLKEAKKELLRSLVEASRQ